MGRSRLRGYLKETRQPIYAAAVVFPFFATYHVGTLFLRTTTINGADALILELLSHFSVHTMFASALVLAGCFAVWQARSRGTWEIDTVKLALLYAESFAFAGALYVAFGWIAAHLPLASSAAPRPESRLARLVLYCGAGVYEELVFRGLLLGGLLWSLRRIARLGPATAAAWAALVAAALFALFHYVGEGGDAFTVGSFLQRAAAGLYFSLVFVVRGFGVAAAAHALYDILVGVVVAGA